MYDINCDTRICGFYTKSRNGEKGIDSRKRLQKNKMIKKKVKQIKIWI